MNTKEQSREFEENLGMQKHGNITLEPISDRCSGIFADISIWSLTEGGIQI